MARRAVPEVRGRSVKDERGAALATVIVLGSAMTLFSFLLIDTVRSEGDRSVRAARVSTALQAADGGVEDYIAKLVDDRQYYLHHVHPGEATRSNAYGTRVAAGGTWTGELTWAYSDGKDTWRRLGNGYEYNLQIAAPSAWNQAVRIVSTGRQAGSTTEWHAIEALVRPSSVADFFMITNSDYTAGAGATTYGKIYAGIDDRGVAHDVIHNGTAYADLYAEDEVRGAPTMGNGAGRYDRTNIRTVIKNPISFNNFVASFIDIELAAAAEGIRLDDPLVHGWRLTFQSDGSVFVQPCTRSQGRHLAERAPSCAAGTTRWIPANGAIYVEQSAIVSGVVKGRVTVASNQDVIVASDISYLRNGEDVLGLIAKNDVIVAYWCPTNISWRAAVIAQSGRRRSWGTGETHGTAEFTGAVASNLSPYMNQFRTRIYSYDTSLISLPPPWLPILEDAYTVLLYHEVAAA